jgi:hypothetical protein
MSRKWAIATTAVLAAAGLAAATATAASSTMTFERKAELLAGLAVEFPVSVSCTAPEVTTPISLSVQLQQLQKEGGNAEPAVVNGFGFVPGVVCDGAEHAYTIVVRTFAPEGEPLPLFRRGAALASASLFSCGTSFCTIVGPQAFAEVRIH